MPNVCAIASAVLVHKTTFCPFSSGSEHTSDFSFKLKAVELARRVVRPAARQLGVDERRLCEWIMKEAAFRREEHPSVCRHLEGGGRKPDHHQVEEELALWIIHHQQQYHRLTRKAIAQRASELVNEQSFKASRGWVDKFLKRHDFVIRARTTTGRLPPELGEKVGNFVLFCQKH